MHMLRLSVAASLAVAAASGCALDSKEAERQGPVEDGREAELGTVQLSLYGQAASGNYYVLRNAILLVQGPSSTEFFNTEDNLLRPSISSDVPAGDYTLFLQEGWRLDRYEPNGTLTQGVNAVLTSANPQGFHVHAGERTTVAVSFRSGDDVIGMGGYDIVVDVEETGGPGPQAGYCQNDSDCTEGATCCLAGFLGTCQVLAEGESCALPDLTVSEEAARNSLLIRHEVFPESSCSLVEGCVGGAGDRRLLAFSTETPNVGEADMILGSPSDELGFEYSSCHGHYHFEGYANYQLLDAQGAVVATGHKQAFCLLDSSQVVPGSASSPRYHCGFQGIQAGWSDVYGAGLDCQWVDITDVPAGDYVLTITINHERTLPESNYDNNTVSVPVTIPEDGASGGGDPLSSCLPGDGGAARDCGLQRAAGFEQARCTPGETVQVGCGCRVGGSCAGDPVLRVCEGGEPCSYTESLTTVDDTCGPCPYAAFVCPGSGTYNVLVGPYNVGSPFTCDVATASSGGSLPPVPSADAGIGGGDSHAH